MSSPITLEQMIKQYTGPEGGFISRNGSSYMAVVDGPFITARTTPDGYPAALLAAAQLHGGGKLPAKYVVDGDGRGHEPTEDEISRAGGGGDQPVDSPRQTSRSCVLRRRAEPTWRRPQSRCTEKQL